MLKIVNFFLESYNVISLALQLPLTLSNLSVRVVQVAAELLHGLLDLLQRNQIVLNALLVVKVVGGAVRTSISTHFTERSLQDVDVVRDLLHGLANVLLVSSDLLEQILGELPEVVRLLVVLEQVAQLLDLLNEVLLDEFALGSAKASLMNLLINFV